MVPKRLHLCVEKINLAAPLSARARRTPDRQEGRGEWTGMGGLRAAHKNMRPAGRFTAPWDAADIGLLRSLRGLPVIRVVLI
ncbi:hypothetical protein CE91St46_03660 [Eubacteriales bacterium]|nr:hypothetical protein CE91St46_03660 [Eubacteriales bacterium]GKH61896.1 hypothetical protein CE91St47_03650 [Eubacteriales bacterium]